MKTNKFIEESIKIHGNRYNYKNTKYTNARTKIKIICPEHNEFEQLPGNHKRGNGCPKCIYNKLTKKEVLKQFKKIHGDKYDYSLIDYNGDNVKVKIICSEHGVFKQVPGIHKLGSGCKKCAGLEKLDNEKVVEQFKETHGDKYNYSLINYINAHTKVNIICPEHGRWRQTPNNHKNGNGCPICKESKGERKIRNLLNENKVNFISQYKFKDCKNILQLPFDFYLPEYNICIEYNGMQHYKPIEHFGGRLGFKKRIINDNIKKGYCEKNNILLITINYNEDVEKKLNLKW